MKTGQNFWVYSILMVMIQIVLTNYFHVSPLLTLSLLPPLILCLPPALPPAWSPVLAFLVGLLVDAVSEAELGLNAASLVLAAFARRSVIKSIFDKETVERGNTISVRKNGLMKVSAALLILYTLFLGVYITADGAGTRGFIFNLGRYLLSLPLCYILGLIVVNIYSGNDKR
ncbi:MAG: hypothetical protein MJY56_00440 [Bacteroidales bacterium]|nr:hypothetical protein [Bacteroidales bacterium]